MHLNDKKNLVELASRIQCNPRSLDLISELDDQDLLQSYGTKEEQDEGFVPIIPPMQMRLRNIELRATLEARARADLRIIEAQALMHQVNKL